MDSKYQSNITTSARTLSMASLTIKISMAYWMAYGLPVIVAIGLVSNPLIAIVMQKRQVAVKKRNKTYYTMLAVADFSILLVVHFGQGFLGDGHAPFFLITFDSAFCRVFIF